MHTNFNVDRQIFSQNLIFFVMKQELFFFLEIMKKTFNVDKMFLHFPIRYPGSGVVLDCIDS